MAEYILIYGFRRFDACKKLGWKKIPVKVGEEFKEVLIKNIELKKNSRTNFKDQSDLMRSIRDNGLLQPVGVILSKDYSEKAFTLVNAVENVQRQNLTPPELGKVIEELKNKHGLNYDEISARLNLNRRQVIAVGTLFRNCPSEFHQHIGYMKEDRRDKTESRLSTTIVNSILGLSLSKRNKHKLLKYARDNSISVAELRVLRNLLSSGNSVEESLKKYKKYTSFNTEIVADVVKLNKLLNKHNLSKRSLILNILNRKIPLPRNLFS